MQNTEWKNVEWRGSLSMGIANGADQNQQATYYFKGPSTGLTGLCGWRL